MNKKRRPIIVRLWRILRMALGLIFSRRELWTVVSGSGVEEAVHNARNACPFPNALLGIMVNQLPGYRASWRVRYIYKGQP